MSPYGIYSPLGLLGMGVIIGGIPLFFGFVKGKKRLAIFGFFTCVISNFLMLALPICIVFMFFILRKPKSVVVK